MNQYGFGNGLSTAFPSQVIIDATELCNLSCTHCPHPAFKANAYVSGPAAKDYVTDESFRDAGIAVTWKDYSGYPPYEQLHRPFSHAVSILDLLFHTGPAAPFYIWGWCQSGRVAA